MDYLILVTLYFGIAYIVSKIHFEHTSSFVVFMLGLLVMSVETFIMVFILSIILTFQVKKNWKTYCLQYGKI